MKQESSEVENSNFNKRLQINTQLMKKSIKQIKHKQLFFEYSGQ